MVGSGGVDHAVAVADHIAGGDGHVGQGRTSADRESLADVVPIVAERQSRCAAIDMNGCQLTGHVVTEKLGSFVEDDPREQYVTECRPAGERLRPRRRKPSVVCDARISGGYAACAIVPCSNWLW